MSHSRPTRNGLRTALSTLVLAAVILQFGGAAAAAAPEWVDWPANPVYSWGLTHASYYPDVIYSATGFDGHGPAYNYKMYYDDGTNTWLAYSNDGETWSRWGIAPIIGNSLRHPQVAYDADAFGDHAGDLINTSYPETYLTTPYYKMWLWDMVNNYIRLAYSLDGEIWYTNYPRDTCPRTGPGWLNPGSPVYDLEIIYDGSTYRGWADNNGRMYNVSSADGSAFTLSTEETIAIDLGAPGAWDSGSLSRMAVVKLAEDDWLAWYGGAPGGGGNAGIGYATSIDGLRWTKETSVAPLASLGGYGATGGLGAPGTWNESRNYAMSVIYDADDFGAHGTAAAWKMWRSGKDVPGFYSLGLAMADLAKTPTSLSCTVSSGLVNLGEQVGVWGRLTDAAGTSIGDSGRAVAVWARSGDTAPDGPDTLLGAATYDADNDVYWMLTSPTAAFTSYRVAFAGDDDYEAVNSPARVVETDMPEPAAVSATVTRVSGATRYDVAVNLAKTAYPGFVGIRHVIVSSGLDRAMADPLTASGLTSLYDAPILLVDGTRSDKKLTNATKVALGQIVAANPGQTIYVHVVGGTTSVPSWVVTAIGDVSPAINASDRVAGADRYEVALNIAKRMQSVLGASYPRTAFVTNGENSAYFFNALSAAPVTVQEHFPILLTRTSAMPYTSWAKASYDTFYAVGSSSAVPESVRTSLGATRISGANRFEVGTNLATTAVANSWLTNTNVAVTNKISDAVTGGSVNGLLGGPMLYTDTSSLNSNTKTYLQTHAEDIEDCYVLGGPVSVTDTTLAQIRAALVVP